MNKLIIILTAFNFISPVFSIVKGVSPDDQYKYQPDKNGNWHCLNDPTIVIPFDKINDNYCDCPDGSDEPNTNACPNGKHFCENIGFKSQYISSNKINDGVCDYSICCDGSDEPIGFCENRCEAMNIENKKQILQKNNIIANGLKEKEKIMKNSSNLKQKLNLEIENINNKIDNINSNLENLSNLKQTLIKNADNNDELILKKFSKLDQNLKDFEKFNENLNKVNDLSNDLNLLESVLKKMADEYNHNFNDPAVKAAANSFLHYYAKKIDSNDANIDVQDLINDFKNNINSINSEINNIKSNLIESINSQDLNLNLDLLDYNTNDENNNENNDKNNDLTFKDLLKSGLKKLLSFFFGIKNRSIAEPNTESNELTELEINNKIDFFNDELKKLEEDLKSKHTELNKNYGPNDILRSLNDCIVNKIGNYNYKLCLNSHLEQIDENGVITKIGFFNSIDFDEKTNQYKIFFKNGQRCWNGPLREGIITISCGEKQEIKLVTEPEKCQYHVSILSPIGCFENDIV